MRKKGLWIVVICLLMEFICLGIVAPHVDHGRAEASGFDFDVDQNVFILPDALISIEEEVFEGIAAKNILLPGSLQMIHDRAFANIPSLFNVYIPETVKWISNSAFQYDQKLKIIGHTGSYAEQWACKNGYSFYYADTSACGIVLRIQQKLEIEKKLLSVFLLVAFVFLLLVLRKRKPNARKSYEGRTKRPQESSVLHAIAYRFP